MTRQGGTISMKLSLSYGRNLMIMPLKKHGEYQVLKLIYKNLEIQLN